MATNNSVNIDRDYVDNYSVKEYANNTLIPKYFETEVSNRTVGMLGYVNEMVSNISEDIFNTGSVYFREQFPNRAKIPESIYSHGAIFQLSNIFSHAASCQFILVLETATIVKNMSQSSDSGIYYFYIDKNTQILVEDIPFILDYDIRIRAVQKISDDGSDEYIFSATYDTTKETNSISRITDPYIKIHRSSDGYISLIVTGRQYTRLISYHSILNNTKINSPIIDVPFNGKLAGFDVFYKKANETTYTTQMITKLVYSQPTSDPFCYYQLTDEGNLRLTFNTKDMYFMPAFNSELKVILYLTNGADGNFVEYNGTDVQIVSSAETYEYGNTYLTSAKPLPGGSTGGTDQTNLEALQALTVEAYRTANALTTENDLDEFFRNYKYNYNENQIKFIKKRDDVFERVFSAYVIIRDGNYIYKGNTLDLNLNLGDMENPENDVYIIEPGTLFTNTVNGYADFYRVPEKEAEYRILYDEAVKNGTTPFINDGTDPREIPAYLNRPCSFAMFKERNNLDDKLSIFEITADEVDKLALDNAESGKFLLINPFLLRFHKNPNIVNTYMTFVNKVSSMDFTSQNADSIVQFVSYQVGLKRGFTSDKKYTISLSVFPSVSIDESHTIIAHTTDEDDNIIYDEALSDKYSVDKNDLRVIFATYDENDRMVCFTELYPTEFDGTITFGFTGELYTDDHITSSSRMRITNMNVYRYTGTEPIKAPYNTSKMINPGDYYQMKKYKNYSEKDNTLYTHYDSEDNVIESEVTSTYIIGPEGLLNKGLVKIWSVDAINSSDGDEVLIPMSDVRCKVFTLYHRIWKKNEKNNYDLLEITDSDDISNEFEKYDPSFKNYMVTNEYSTITEPLTFIEQLSNIRCDLEFKNFMGQNGSGNFIYDIYDVNINSIPFLRWNVYDNDDPNNTKLSYFMQAFLGQYNNIDSIISTRLRNQTNIDLKLYNTYGLSSDFVVGENNQLLNMVNLTIEFDMWFTSGTNLLVAIPEVKQYIKTQIETIDDAGTNSLYISNLMRKIESNFAYVDHIRFVRFNNYDSSYQTIKNNIVDLNDLTKEERRKYVPELLTVDLENIIINSYSI